MTQEIIGYTLLAWLVYCAICCGLAAYIAAEKNRPDWEPWVFGFLFGPLGILIVACLPTRLAVPKAEPAIARQVGSPQIPPPTERVGRTAKPLRGEIDE